MTTGNFKTDLQELYNTAPCGYLCTSPSGQIIEANKRFLDFVGYTSEEVIGLKNLTDFLTVAGRIFHETNYQVVLKLQGEVKEVNFSFVRKDLSQFPILINSIEVKDKKGVPAFTQSTIFDISQRKKYEQQLLDTKRDAVALSKELATRNELLEQQTKELNLAKEELENLAYVATHDLKLPIINIEGHFQYLKEKLPKENADIAESIGFVDESILQYKQTIHGLIEAIRLRESQVQLEAINLIDILEVIIPTLQAKAKEVGGVLNISIDSKAYVWGNGIYITSILQNIIGNAIKYRSSERKLEIKISGKELKEHFQMKVEDNGIGIDLEMNGDKLFGMFNRFSNHVEGSGMGLYMTKKMIEAVGGKIEVESVTDKGSTFYIYFKK